MFDKTFQTLIAIFTFLEEFENIKYCKDHLVYSITTSWMNHVLPMFPHKRGFQNEQCLNLFCQINFKLKKQLWTHWVLQMSFNKQVSSPKLNQIWQSYTKIYEVVLINFITKVHETKLKNSFNLFFDNANVSCWKWNL